MSCTALHATQTHCTSCTAWQSVPARDVDAWQIGTASTNMSSRSAAAGNHQFTGGAVAVKDDWTTAASYVAKGKKDPPLPRLVQDWRTPSRQILGMIVRCRRSPSSSSYINPSPGEYQTYIPKGIGLRCFKPAATRPGGDHQKFQQSSGVPASRHIPPVSSSMVRLHGDCLSFSYSGTNTKPCAVSVCIIGYEGYLHPHPEPCIMNGILIPEK